MDARFDITIVGAGMAGASLAAALVPLGVRMALIEAEAAPGYHATGRSAAFWTESYGGPGVQPLTTASGRALREGGYLTPRGALTIARAGQENELDAFAARYAALGVKVVRLDRAGTEERVPGLRPDWACAALEPACCDIDVARLHQDYLAAASRAGAELFTSARLARAERCGDGWALTLGAPFHPLAVLLSCIAAGGCSLPLDDPRPSSVVTSGDSLALGASVAPGRGDLSRLLATALLWPGLRLLILRYPGFVITNDALHGTNSEDRALLATDGNRDGAECHGEPRKLDGRAALIFR